jgi:hypothetical protein
MFFLLVHYFRHLFSNVFPPRTYSSARIPSLINQDVLFLRGNFKLHTTEKAFQLVGFGQCRI